MTGEVFYSVMTIIALVILAYCVYALKRSQRQGGIVNQ